MTRSSSELKVRDLLLGLRLKEVSLGRTGRSAATGYEDWLVRRILAHFDIDEAETVARVCGGLPVLAAFAAFLFVKDRSNFSKQFENLQSVQDFETWSGARLRFVEERFPGRQSVVRRKLAELAIQLPMDRDRFLAFRAYDEESDTLADILVSDRWVEADAAEVSAAHDVLADAMLARYLFETPALIQERVTALLTQGFDLDRPDLFDRMLAAVDRLAPHDAFSEISGYRLAHDLLKNDRCGVMARLPVLLRGRTLMPEDIARFLSDDDALATAVAETPATHLPVARAAERLAADGELEGLDQPLEALGSMLSHAVRYPHPSNMVLRCAHAFDPHRYRDSVIARLDAEPVHPDSHYLIVSLVSWHGHRAIPECAFQAWLGSNAVIGKASFVYKSWLDAGGGVDAVRDAIQSWIGTHGPSAEASFVYKSWLDAGGSVDAVRDAVLRWLDAHGASAEAQFVYKSWLDAGGGVDAVRDAIQAWIGTHGPSAEACFVYKSWLDAGGGVDAVRDAVLRWLDAHGASAEAQFVYKSWLDAGGGVDAVRDAVLRWLDAHGPTAEAGFVYQSWLKAGHAFEEIRPSCQAWLYDNWHLEDAVFVTKEISKQPGLDARTLACIVAWSGLHCDHEDAIFRFSRASGQFDALEMAPAFRSLVAMSFRCVVMRLLEKQELTSDERLACNFAFENMSGRSFFRNLHWTHTLSLFVKCLEHGRVLMPGTDRTAGIWVFLLSHALQDRILVPDRDRKALAEALDLIRQNLGGHGLQRLLACGCFGEFTEWVERAANGR